MPVNPKELIQMIRQGANPQQLVLSVLEKQSQNNPMVANLLSLAKNGDSAGLEQFARNYVTSQGKDFDKEFNAFKQNYGL